MRQFFRFVFIALLLFATSLVSAETPSRLLHRAQAAITQVIVHDIFSPPVASRIYLYSSLSAFEALTVKPGQPSFHQVRPDFTKPVSDGFRDNVNVELSAVYAMMYTASRLVFSDSMLLDSLNAIVKDFHDLSPAVITKSVQWALSVSDAVMQWSKTDQYAATRKLRRYAFLKDGSSWIPTPPGYFQAVEPYWGKLRTVALDSASQYKPEPPIAFSSVATSPFFLQAKEVYSKSINLTRQDSIIAMFWDCNPFHLTVQGHVNFATKKLSPGGHWMSIAGIAASASKFDFIYAVKTYLYTSIAIYDAFISCWDEKYRSNVIRPETYINAHIDQSWRPLLQTPPFPEYTSGHSVISASAAAVLTFLFGKNFSFLDTTEMPYGLPSRQFSSFEQAAQEAAISRFYGGIHYRQAVEMGLKQGQKIGDKVIAKMITLKD